MDLKHIARLHIGLADVAQGFDQAIGSHDDVLPNQPWLAARHAKRALFVAFGQDAGGHGL